MFDEWLTEELEVIKSEIGENRYKSGRFKDASTLFSEMIKKDEFDEFLTIPAYNYLN
jgi:malate synthase